MKIICVYENNSTGMNKSATLLGCVVDAQKIQGRNS